jgi:hypothetical protein
MIPRKTKRGEAALERLKVFEGIPPPYDKQKRMVVPQALRVLRLKPGRKYCTVGRISSEVCSIYKGDGPNADFRMAGNTRRHLRNLKNAVRRNLRHIMQRRKLICRALRRQRVHQLFLRNLPSMDSREAFSV